MKARKEGIQKKLKKEDCHTADAIATVSPNNLPKRRTGCMSVDDSGKSSLPAVDP